ncbi:MAG: hypothetical protein LBL90_05785 [Prevotellaceae bacterium]|jgi:hypothetical protein|nr:hypothetical protein [Prevotellaceae bacterium]
MKLYRCIFTVLIATVVFTACKSTGQKALNKGDYFTACLQAIEKLRSSSNNEKAIDALSKAYPLAITYIGREVERLLSSSSNKNRYMQIYNLYGQMNRIAVEISKSPAALRVIPNPDYYNLQLESACNMAAEETYQKAESSLRKETRSAAKEAYSLYLQTNDIIAGYKDVVQKAEEARWLATLKVVIEQRPVAGTYKISADFFQNKVFEYFSNNIRNKFIRVYSPQEAEQNKLTPDQIIRLEFLDFVVGQMRESKDTKEVKRDSVIVGIYKDDKGREHNVYGTVEAKLTIRKREVSSNGLLNAIIVDYASNKILSQQRFPGIYTWTDMWGSFNGDERALTSKELAMCRREPYMPPPSQDMFIEFTVPIFNNLTAFIQNYYRNY